MTQIEYGGEQGIFGRGVKGRRTEKKRGGEGTGNIHTFRRLGKGQSIIPQGGLFGRQAHTWHNKV